MPQDCTGANLTTLTGSVRDCCGWFPSCHLRPASLRFWSRQGECADWDSTCGRLAVSPVKVSGVDAGFQRAGDRVSSPLDVSLEQISVQLPHSVHAHLVGRGYVTLPQESTQYLRAAETNTHPSEAAYRSSALSNSLYVLMLDCMLGWKQCHDRNKERVDTSNHRPLKVLQHSSPNLTHNQWRWCKMKNRHQTVTFQVFLLH